MENIKFTSDYGLVAWLVVIKGLRDIADKAQKVRRGKMLYAFDVVEDEWTKLRLEYIQSDFPKFLNEIKLRKDPSF